MARLQNVDAPLHGVTDYTVGSLLLTVFPRLAGISGTRSARQVRISGGFHAAYSLLTAYPLGAVKLIPFKAPLALDALGALAIGATPFLTGQYKEGRRQWLPHVGLALFELQSLAQTDPTGRGSWHGDVEAVREANELDPHTEIYARGPAVTA